MKPLSTSRLLRDFTPLVAGGRARRLGEIAVDAGVLTPDQLRDCERRAAEHPDVPFRRILEEHAGLQPQVLDLLESLLLGSGTLKRLANRYEIRREIGRGALGTVHEAMDLKLDRRVAVKMLKSDGHRMESLIKRFEREAQVVARLQHRHIVVLFDFGHVGDVPFLVMELVEGPTLAERPARGWSFAQCARVMEKVARAIHHAHEAGVVHRDLKPGNIKLDAKGEPRVLDFGLAQLLEGAKTLTRTGAAVGTPMYMSPEQARGDRDAIGPLSDVYGLGATLYEISTGRAPFAGESTVEIFGRILAEEPPSPQSLNPAFPLALQQILAKAMAKDPRNRYASALEMAEDLRRFQEGEPVHGRGVGAVGRLGGRIRRRPLAAAAAILAVSVLAGLGILALRSSAEGRRLRDELRQAELAGRISGAYLFLSQRTQGAMRDLEDFRHGAPLADPGARLADVESAASEAASRFPGSNLPKAWLALARTFADRDGAAAELEALAAAEREDPYPGIFFALSLMSEYLLQADREARSNLGARFAESEGLRRLREKAQLHLRRAQERAVWKRLPPEQIGVLVEGAALFSEGRWEEAARRLEALVRHPELGVRAQAFRGIALSAAGRFGDAAAAWEDVLARGWAIAATPAPWSRIQEARALSVKGQDPRPAYARAAALATEQIAKADAFAPRYLRGIVRLESAPLEGGRAETTLAAALEDFEAMARLAPSRQEGFELAGYALHKIALLKPGDVESLDRAIEFFDRAVELAPSVVGIRRRRGDARFERGRRSRPPRDPEPDYRSALADFTAYLEKFPEDPGALEERGLTFQWLGRLKSGRGEDPRPLFREALHDLEHAIRGNPPGPAPYTNRGGIQVDLADAERRHGGDPLPLYEAAVRDHGIAVERDPVSGRGWFNRGIAQDRIADVLRERDRDPVEHFDLAIISFTRALEADAGYAAALLNRAYTRLEKGKWLAQRSGPAGPVFVNAIMDLNTYLAKHPHAAAYRSRATARDNLARLRFLAGEDPEEMLKAALADFAEALRLDPSWTGLLVERGMTSSLAGDCVSERGRDGAPYWTEALSDFRKASESRPTADLQVRIGNVLERLRQPAEAVEAYERALELDPGHSAARKRLEQLK